MQERVSAGKAWLPDPSPLTILPLQYQEATADSEEVEFEHGSELELDQSA